jgi:hypothetical protein
MAAKRLTWDDMKKPEDYDAERRQFTDERAQKLGYPSAEVLHLYDHLSKLAGEWRSTKSETVAHEYGKTLLDMILKGYDVDSLPIQDQLPSELMPEIPPSKVREAIAYALSAK